MRGVLEAILIFAMGDPQADRIVPPTGFTARLTLWSAGAMAFLAVFALAFSLATGRLADRWSDDLARTATIRISAPAGQMQIQTNAVMAILETTPGVAQARIIEPDEQRALLAPWFGADFQVETLPIPQLIEIREGGLGIDPENLRLRLLSEAPAAILDTHERWKRPLVQAATRLRILGWGALIMIVGIMAAMVTLAAQSALVANVGIIKTLRLIGARDAYIAQAFMRRFTLRALIGAAAGTAIGTLGLLFIPSAAVEGGFLTGLRISGFAWGLVLLIPLISGLVAYLATKRAANKMLRGIS